VGKPLCAYPIFGICEINIVIAHSESCERNKYPILSVLTDAFAEISNVLEIGSGTGQHAVFFANNLSHIKWQPSELTESLPSLHARLASEGPGNVGEPLTLNVRDHPWLGPNRPWPDGLFTANTLHIMSWLDVEHFFTGVGQVLAPKGVLCIYGPFRYCGHYTSESNAAFDRALKNRDPLSGIRDFEAIADLAESQGLRFLKDHSMPANNQLLVWIR
jgi:SAM-dependent methyltransferase